MDTMFIEQMVKKIAVKKKIRLTPNQIEQVKSILVKRLVEKDWDMQNEEKVIEVINYINPSNQDHDFNLLSELLKLSSSKYSEFLNKLKYKI